MRDPAVHQEVIQRVKDGAAAQGLRCTGVIESPIKGATGGNTEFLARFVLDGGLGDAADGLTAALAGELPQLSTDG